MPHDKHGRILEVGDEVLIRARVKQLWPGAAVCNAQLETVEKMTPDRGTGEILTLNANQVEKVDAPAPAA